MGGEFNKSKGNDITLHEFTSDSITEAQLEEWYSNNEEKFEFPKYSETLENRFEYWKKQFPEIMKELSSLLRASSSFGYNLLLNHYVVIQNLQLPINSNAVPKKVVHFQDFLNHYLLENGFTEGVNSRLIQGHGWNYMNLKRLDSSIEPIISNLPSYSPGPRSTAAILTIRVYGQPREG